MKDTSSYTSVVSQDAAFQDPKFEEVNNINYIINTLKYTHLLSSKQILTIL